MSTTKLPSPRPPQEETSEGESFIFCITQGASTDWGKNRANYHYWILRFTALGLPALQHGTSNIIKEVHILSPNPVHTWYDTSPQPLAAFEYHNLTIHPLTVKIQWGHKLSLEGRLFLTDGQILPFTHTIEKLNDDDPEADYTGLKLAQIPPVHIPIKIYNLPKLNIVDYIVPTILSFKMNISETGKLYDILYKGEHREIKSLKYENDVVKVALKGSSEEVFTYNGLVNLGSHLSQSYEVFVSESLNGHLMRKLKPWQIQSLNTLMHKILWTTRTKALFLPKDRINFKFNSDEEIKSNEYENERSDDNDDGGDEETVLKSGGNAVEMLVKLLKVSEVEAGQIVQILKKIIEDHNLKALWKLPTPATGQLGLKIHSKAYRRYYEPSDYYLQFKQPVIPVKHSERLSEFIPQNLAILPELSEVWWNVKAVLWMWEKISRYNWEYRKKRQNTLRDEKKVLYNPQQFYLLMVLSKTQELPTEVVWKIRDYLPPIFYAGTYFSATSTDSGSYVSVYVKAIVRLYPESNRFDVIEEKESSQWTSYECYIRRHSGTYTLNEDLLLCSVTEFKGGDFNHNDKKEPTTISTEPLFTSFQAKIIPDLKYGGIKLRLLDDAERKNNLVLSHGMKILRESSQAEAATRRNIL